MKYFIKGLQLAFNPLWGFGYEGIHEFYGRMFIACSAVSMDTMSDGYIIFHPSHILMERISDLYWDYDNVMHSTSQIQTN
jgi:hypothetical protein